MLFRSTDDSPTFAGLDIKGGYRSSQIPAPAAPTVTPQGTAGTVSWGYKITALDGAGETEGSTEGTTTTGNATLDTTNFNRIVWSAVSGAVNYKVYRTTASGTPATTGLVGTISATATLQLDDTGLTAGAAVPAADTTGSGYFAGNVIIGATTGANILTIQQTSATDPIADSWTVYSTRETKDILNQVTDYTSILDEFNHTPVHQWKRKLKKPLLADYIDIKQSTTDEAGEKVEKITTIQEQYDIAFAEFQKKSSLPKFQQPKYSLVAEEAPEFVKSYDDTGKLIGIDLLAYVGWLHACLKGFVKGKL